MTDMGTKLPWMGHFPMCNYGRLCDDNFVLKYTLCASLTEVRAVFCQARGLVESQ